MTIQVFIYLRDSLVCTSRGRVDNGHVSELSGFSDMHRFVKWINFQDLSNIPVASLL